MSTIVLKSTYFSGYQLVILLPLCIFRPLQHPHRLHRVVSECPLQVLNIILWANIMPQLAQVVDTLRHLTPISQDHSVLLRSHIRPIHRPGMEHLYLCFILVGLGLHPLGAHDWCLMHVALLFLLETILPAHRWWVNCKPAAITTDDGHCRVSCLWILSFAFYDKC